MVALSETAGLISKPLTSLVGTAGSLHDLQAFLAKENPQRAQIVDELHQTRPGEPSDLANAFRLTKYMASLIKDLAAKQVLDPRLESLTKALNEETYKVVNVDFNIV